MQYAKLVERSMSVTPGSSPLPSDTAGRRILVIDDDPDHAQTVRTVLTDEGYQVDVAADGREGLRQARELRPDMILLDVLMPGLDGFNVATRISEEMATQNIPILFVSGVSDLPPKVRGLKMHEVDFLQKPYSLDELLARVDRALVNAAALEHLRLQAHVDELTGLGNLRFLHERLALEQARFERYGTPVTMVVIDVDRLKQINDQHGHAAGSEVLKAIGGVLRDAIRETDLAVRYGGDEFVVVLPHTTLADGIGFSQRVLGHIRRLRPQGIVVSVSVGLASCGKGDPRDLKALLEDADTAAYSAKRLGGDRACAFSSTATP